MVQGGGRTAIFVGGNSKKKMPKSCSVPYCRSRYNHNNKEVTFHRFPFSRPELLVEWISRIGYASFRPKRHTVICSAHFIPDCFSKYGNRKNLKENAIPTVFVTEEQRLEKLQQLQDRIDKNYLKNEKRIKDEPKNEKRIKDEPKKEEESTPPSFQKTRCWKKKMLDAAQYAETKFKQAVTTWKTVGKYKKFKQAVTTWKTVGKYKGVKERANFYSKKIDPHPIQVIDHSYAIGDSGVLKKKLYFALEENERLRKRMKAKNLKLRRLNENLRLLQSELQFLKDETPEESMSKAALD